MGRSYLLIGSWRLLRRIANFMVISLFAIVAGCGGGGSSSDGGGAPPASIAVTPVNSVSPDNGALVFCCSAEFVLRNSAPSKYTGGVYEITIYNDYAGTETVAVSEPLTEDASGEARWTAPTTLDENRMYWWSWKAAYASAEVKSGIGVFHVMTRNALQAAAPRHTGWMDANFAINPTIAAFDAFGGTSLEALYDMQLFMDSALTAPVATVTGLVGGTGRYIIWRPAMTLATGSTYYWRVRAVLYGVPSDWVGPYQFTTQDPCLISGSQYASYGIDWITQRQCSSLLLTDMSGALGSSNAGYPWRNFMSIDDGGEAVFEMGAAVIDGAGKDLRIYQYISNEPIEVLAGPTEVGPWYSLGTTWCADTCDFDLGYADVAYARYIKVRDLTSPEQLCHETAGADIDAIVALNVSSGSTGCPSFGGLTASTAPSVPSEVVHSVPHWIKDTWTVAEIGMGTDYTANGFTMTITDTGFEYHYTGCDVKGRIAMDPLAPMNAANWYVMIMDQVDCPQQWDIPTYTGTIDVGYIWSAPDGWLFYRSSFYNSIDFWAYTR